MKRKCNKIEHLKFYLPRGKKYDFQKGGGIMMFYVKYRPLQQKKWAETRTRLPTTLPGIIGLPPEGHTEDGNHRAAQLVVFSAPTIRRIM